ncbi:hypothetical protein LTR10_008256 [Elasticomyces elasticus]|uniref:EXPERA domain-containing protein n=1 Tax=Elasticomyces elasticus TaxID=574655 RepID=A0AAN7W0G2_9PEZI|nr:hypothetical protein LTR10_008256 [Elasticomyces elasticus]KAK4967132.1 hypothetical protein LTR42_010480 [Elasticomyces elasticus]KAK5694839.1 hypothetical protein LTR97_009430 [Elasticomyces elasticus]KAK5728584.1 hypothetical protein LTR15_001721 [Elasticomyces elasticus]
MTGLANSTDKPMIFDGPTRDKDSAWSHTPPHLVLVWLAISLPLVLWDSGYVLLRPHSMSGGILHTPLWAPYALYAEVDKVYGTKALEEHNGWTATQTSFNIVETVGYLTYLYLVYTYGEIVPSPGHYQSDPRHRISWHSLKGLNVCRMIHGHVAARAVLLAYSMALLTFSKSSIYWLIEAYSGFDNIGHNNMVRIIFVWIIPNGFWLVFPLYMAYIFGTEILRGLNIGAKRS